VSNPRHEQITHKDAGHLERFRLRDPEIPHLSMHGSVHHYRDRSARASQVRLGDSKAGSADHRFCGPRLFGPVMERSNSCARIGGHFHAVHDQTAAFVLFLGASWPVKSLPDTPARQCSAPPQRGRVARRYPSADGYLRGSSQIRAALRCFLSRTADEKPHRNPSADGYLCTTHALEENVEFLIDGQDEP